MIYFILWVILSFGIGELGKNRTCGFFWSFLCSLIFSPIIGAIYVALSDRNSDVKIRKEQEKILLEQRLKNALDLYEKGLMSKDDFDRVKGEYTLQTNPKLKVNPLKK